MAEIILAACVIVSAGSASYAGANLGVALREAYEEYVEERGDVYAFETPGGVIIVESGAKGEAT